MFVVVDGYFLVFRKPVSVRRRGQCCKLKLTIYYIHCNYLVDPASSHMLVSKIKPCMSKYKQLYSETANGSLYKLSFI